MLNLLVRIFDDPLIRQSHQSGRQALHILTPLHFTQAPRVETLPHQRAFRLRHGAFEPEQEAVVRETRIVDAVRIANERS